MDDRELYKQYAERAQYWAFVNWFKALKPQYNNDYHYPRLMAAGWEYANDAKNWWRLYYADVITYCKPTYR